MKSIADLKKIRDKARHNISLRESGERTQVRVYMGTCGIAAGARKVMTAILDELGKNDISDVEVLQKGCIGLCEHEPLVEVEIKGEGSVMYGHIDEEKARRIVNKHVINNVVLDEWVVNCGCSIGK
ncbi:(2Fe-2S) ferredoxin domain-containing protein [Clostridium sp. 'deep sea']|uniref:(2Fe-2S) ferredoxin domain-containing protein n=1 Tax=Clostridium sp. 'deep sea' TaxID=2779445 RepID=UPI0018969856|nr:(2Fe-2S) ferredoxin domain-containing protein [Clostridium sp. 'deep sea']QOR36365.1 (2Fe-2S) ferredoxin domain-containing protein [Clostridium sp. 'deep sea']